MKLGILPLGRPTFDVPFAEEKLAGMLARLDGLADEIVGPRRLLMDGAETEAAISDLVEAGIDRLLVLQVTFTDAAAIVAAAGRFAGPLAIWAVPEPRLGGRLRLNAFCGLNLASHALGRGGRGFGWLYADPAGASADDLGGLLAGARDVEALSPGTPGRGTELGRGILARIHGKRIGRLGERPTGFDTCDYDPATIRELTGVTVDALELDRLFDTARALPEGTDAPVREELAPVLKNLGAVDQPELTRSLRLKVALDVLQAEKGFDAFAIRCWPETFTEYGGAVCGAVSMLGQARVPCACEADVYGALTQLILQEVCDAPVFLTDLVDLDSADNTGVVWHCGQAPLSMCAGEAEATIHTNRKMPLLLEFTLRPGEVTFMRVSQSCDGLRMVISHGEMLDRPMTFTGTSGVVRFDGDAGAVAKRVMDSGLEHHMALAYGDHRDELRDVAAAMGLPVLEI